MKPCFGLDQALLLIYSSGFFYPTNVLYGLYIFWARVSKSSIVLPFDNGREILFFYQSLNFSYTTARFSTVLAMAARRAGSAAAINGFSILAQAFKLVMSDKMWTQLTPWLKPA